MWSTSTKQRKHLKLSDDLERAILHGIISGVVNRDAIEPDEVSKQGRLVLASCSNLLDGGVQPPLSYTSLLLTATDVLGAPKDSLKEYLRAISTENVGSDAGAILQRVRDKQLILDLINEGSAQLQKGTIDVGLLSGVLNRDSSSNSSLSSIGTELADGMPARPSGLELSSLRNLSHAAGGVFGVWAIAGEPGVGKTALATQISLDVARHIPVIYYDFETGRVVLMYRMLDIFKGDLEKLRHATERIYIRDSIRSLDRDLGSVPAPALVVIDSIQKLPASTDQRRQGLDRWIRRLEELKKRGYTVLLVSEVGRSQYGNDAYIGAFKETGAVEYAADLGLQLLPLPGSELVEAHIVKNRHHPKKGSIGYLARKNNWWFTETNSTQEEID